MVAWAGVERYRLGLWEQPPTQEEASSDWVDVRARWPLTSERHPRAIQPVRKRKLKVTKKVSRLPHESLTDITRAALLLESNLDGRLIL
jgi:hypothetical protein